MIDLPVGKARAPFSVIEEFKGFGRTRRWKNGLGRKMKKGKLDKKGTRMKEFELVCLFQEKNAADLC